MEIHCLQFQDSECVYRGLSVHERQLDHRNVKREFRGPLGTGQRYLTTKLVLEVDDALSSPGKLRPNGIPHIFLFERGGRDDQRVSSQPRGE